MKAALKHIVAHTYKPLLQRYLSKTRIFRYYDIKLKVPPGVFHPGFFSSTQLLLKYISNMHLPQKTFLELGAGSGLIAIRAAKKNATVTASDINPLAIDQLETNSRMNNVKIEVVHSDLFENIPLRKFDIIAINPPYYKKLPLTFADHAWYCGEKGEFFFRLFQQLPAYTHAHSAIVMVLCDGCDIPMIKKAAGAGGFDLKLVKRKQYLLEKSFIYSIEKRYD